MSQATASLPATRRTPAESGAPRLEALPRASRRSRPKLFYAAIAVLTVMIVVVTQLLLSIGVSQGAYKIESLQADKARLARQYQQASETVDALSSPQNLAANAEALGMVNNGTPVYLRLSDGALIGSPAPATAAGGGGTGQLVANALTQDLPLVNAPKTSKGKNGGTSGTTGAATTGAAGAADSSTGSGTPTTDQAKADDSPVPWTTGAIPAPSTH
ncbi:hypothetical protein HII28_00670 [Planctomonas sp. JC2975]|uniref:hypothetical protein n=1 Tax=Planctomonas sp. JC2975 TaxID=2729626 RepID=UPI0014742F6D|nr:hypothetical protein [Planctomonas sp. JC2975]NNC10399.1 hypothetical protein [Planctomonas sp. JC2975]